MGKWYNYLTGLDKEKEKEQEDKKDRDDTLSFWTDYQYFKRTGEVPESQKIKEPEADTTDTRPLLEKLAQRGVTIELPEPEKKEETPARTGTSLLAGGDQAKKAATDIFQNRLGSTFTAQQTDNSNRKKAVEDLTAADKQQHEDYVRSLRKPEKIQADIDAAKMELSDARKKWWRDEFLAWGGGIEGRTRTLEENDARNAEIKDRIASLENELRVREGAEKYDSIRYSPDFAQKSKARELTVKERVDDPLYAYVNGDKTSANLLMDANDVLHGKDTLVVEQMTPDEVRTFNYLHATEGKDAAEEYVEFLRPELNARNMEAVTNQVANFTDQNLGTKILGSAGSVAMTPLRGLAYAGQALDYLTTGKVDPNAPYNMYSAIPTAARETVSKDIERKWGTWGSFAYQTGMSMADFLLNSAVAGGSEALSLTIMGTGAAADATISAKERGLDDTQSFVIGTIAGLAEAVSEKVSFEKLFKQADWREQPVKYILQNFFFEGSEEVESDVMNWLADAIVARDKSEWQADIDAYKKENPKATDSEAFWDAVKQRAIEGGMDFLGGAISGGLMASGRVAFDRAANRAQRSRDKSQVIEAEREARKERTAAPVSAQQAEQTQESSEGRIPLPTADDLMGADDASGEDSVIRMGAEPEPGLKTDEQLETEKRIATARNITEATGIKYGVDEKTIRKAERYGRLTGDTVEFYSEEGKNGTVQNGLYDPTTRRLYYNVKANKTFEFTFGHEFTHTTENTDAYRALSDLVEQRIMESGRDIAEETGRIIDRYRRAGITLTEEQARQEIVADWIGENLSDERTIREISRDKASVAKQIRDGLDSFITRAADMSGIITTYEEKKYRNIVGLYDKYLGRIEEAQVRQAEARAESKPAEGAPGQESVEEYRSRMERLYQEGEIDEEQYNDAIAIADEAESTGRGFESSTVEREEGPRGKLGEIADRLRRRYSLSPEDQKRQQESPAFKEFFGDWQSDPENASKVVNEDGSPMVVYHGTNADFTSFDRNQIGSNTGNRGIFGEGFYFTDNAGTAEGYNRRNGEIAADGSGNVMPVYLDVRNPFNWNSISDKAAFDRFIADHGLEDSGIRWNRTQNGIHALDSDEAIRRFTEAIREDGYDGVIYTYPSGAHEYVAFEPEQIKSATDNTGTFDRNNTDIRYSLSAEEAERADADYMAAVETGDMETAQRMVDEAAERAGYTRRMWHGAKNGKTFTTFKGWSYFTEDRTYAEKYSNRDPENLYGVYAKVERPFDTRIDPDAREEFETARQEYGMSMLNNSGLPDWTDGYDIVDYIEENGLNYDAVVLDEGVQYNPDAKTYDDRYRRVESYVIRDSAQIKSADPVTYDDEGNVIPLSERFNPVQEDIRYSITEADDEAYMDAVEDGDTETAQRMVDEAAKRAGYTVKAYHGTNSENFTVFDTSKIGENTGASFYGRGLYFASDERDASSYGKNLMGVYLKMENPLNLDDDNWPSELGLEDRKKVSVTKTSIEDLGRGFYTLYYQTTESGNEWRHINNATKWQIGDDDGVSYLNRTLNESSLLPRDVPDLAELAQEKGFDSIIGAGTNIGDTGKEYVVFSSNQIKSADPVTYDDDGNVIPLSERFNPVQEDIRYSISAEEDEAYMDAVESGDTVAAQRMVDEAARDAGYNSPKLYHGTDYYKQINIFKPGKSGYLGPGIYLTPNESLAKRYADRSGDGGRIYSAWAKIQNPLNVTSDEPAREILREITGSDRVFNNRMAKQAWSTQILTKADMNKLRAKGYDGIIWKYGMSPAEYMVFESSQIKSADPVTYDDAGNVIPLSERFNPVQEDIRYSVSEAEEEPEEVRNIYGITQEDVQKLRAYPKKNINDYTSNDIQEAEKWARKFYAEMGNKSPFFRAWFGDWRRGDNQTQVSIVRKGQSRYDRNGRSTNRDTNMTVSYGKQVRSESINHARGEKSSIDALSNIGDIIENAVYLNTATSGNTSKSKMPNTAFMHHFYALYDDGTGVNLLKLYVEEALTNKNNEIFSRAYQLKDIEKITALPGGVHPASGSLTYGSTATGYSIADLCDLVKTYDKEYQPKESSKVVNDDGTPKMMYHGTNADRDFHIFNTYGSNYGLYGAGSYFTDNPEVASSYAVNKGRGTRPRVYPVYLNIKNPMVMEEDADISLWLDALPELRDYIVDPETYEIKAQTNREFYRAMEQYFEDEGMYDYDAAESAMDVLQSMGYDGIRHVGGLARGDGNPHDVWIAFDPTQIKSATGNRGTFDPENGDIRYSLADTPEAAGPIYSLPAKARDDALRVENALASSLAKMFGVNARHTTDEYKAFRTEVARPIIEAMIEGREVDPDRIFSENWNGSSILEAQGAREDLDDALTDAWRRVQQINTFAQEKASEESARAARNAEIDARIPDTTEGIIKMGETFKDAKRRRSNVMARLLLTDEDLALARAVASGQMTEQEVYARRPFNYRDILEAAEAEKAFRDADEVWGRYTRRIASRLIETADNLLEESDRWRDKGNGFAYARETAERNFRDVMGGDSGAMIDEYIRPIHKSEAESTRFKNEYIARVKKLGLSRKIARGNQASESQAVQFLGEAEDNVRYLQSMRRSDAVRDGKTLDEWRAEIEAFRQANPNLDYNKVERGIAEFQAIYGELINDMNRVLVENGYLPVNVRRGYFPHFNGGDDGILSKFANLLGINIESQALPTAINGLTSGFKPGKAWFGHAQERTGFQTTYDAVEGFEGYIGGVSDVIHQTANIRRLRTLASRIRYRFGDEGIRNQINAIMANDTLDDNQKQVQIDDLTSKGRYKLSRFVAWLDEYTNLLANKKSKYDRGIEDLMGRRVYTWMKNIEGRVAANMISANLGSALTNFIPLNQAGAMLGDYSMLRGAFDTFAGRGRHDGFVNRSDFLTNRRGTDPLIQNRADKISEFLSSPMNIIDNFTSETIVRAAYGKYVRQGMDPDTAMQMADEFAAGVMADRSKGATPTIFSSHNPLTKLLTQFQVEVNNEFSTIFKDIPKGTHIPDREKKNMVAVAAWTLLRYFIGAYLFNDLYEKVVGRRAALDPIDILNDAVGDLTGKKLNNTIDALFTQDGIIEDVERKNPSDATQSLFENTAEELPFIGGLLGGGRIPISSAFPNFENINKAALNENWSTGKKAQVIGRELGGSIGTYILPPFAGGAAKKVIQTAENTLTGGRYVKNAEGEDQIQYPYFTDTPLDTAGTVAKSLLFGPTATEGGRDWVEGGFGNQTAKVTNLYRTLTDDLGESQRTAWDLIQTISSGEYGRDAQAKRYAIAQSDLSDEGKAAAMETYMSESEGRKFRGANQFGVSADAWAALYAGMDEFDANGNSTYSQEEMRDALEGIRVPVSYGEGATQGLFGGSMDDRSLTNREKAVLWAAYGYKKNGKSWKQSNNPYDPDLGERVIDWIEGLVYDADDEE